MANSLEAAARWTEFISTHAAFPAGRRLRAAFGAGTITRLCDCGCNSYDIELAEGAGIAPLVAPDEGDGAVFQMSFEVREPGVVERRFLDFVVFADQRGQFSGLEVDYCGNSLPVPATLELVEPPYDVQSSPALSA